MTRISSKLTYANVMATIAVFIALGGGAFAALRVPKNSVGNKQLRRNSVTGSKVRDATLTGNDIRVHSLTGANLSQIGLANLLGGSGTATNDGTVSQAAGTCGRYVFSASNAQPGDAVMLGGSDIAALAAHAMIGAPTVSTPNKLNITVCALGTTVDQAPATIQLRFDTLR
jgi:hypothetical protein